MPARQALHAALRAGDASWRGLLRNETVEGGAVWWDALVLPIGQGRAAAVHRDATPRVRESLDVKRKDEMLEAAGRLAHVGTWTYDLVSQQFDMSAEGYRLHGLPPDHPPISFREAGEFIEPAYQQMAIDTMRGLLKHGGSWNHVTRLKRADGRSIWVQSFGEAERVGGRTVRIHAAFQDIDETRRLSEQLAQQHELLQVTLRSIGDAVITTDAQGCVRWLNPVAERMTGWSADEAAGRDLAQVFHIVNEETRAPTENPVATCLDQGKVVGLANHTLLIARDGREYGIEDSAAPILGDDGRVHGVVLVFHDVTEQRRLASEMTRRATVDALTGLVNRTEFDARLRRVLHDAHESRSAHALLYIDLDQFKRVNDACGHAVGDQMLQQVARQLAGAMRHRDTLARLGGDEFGAILEHCTVEQAERVAAAICERLEAFRFVHDGQRFRTGVSIGLVPVDARWSRTAAILQAADRACYAAKDAGRNRVHVWVDDDRAVRARHGEMQWAARIEQALDEGRFELHAQRIAPLGAARARLHVELLLRMRDESGALVRPNAFLPAAERFHLASRIDRWVLGEVVGRLGTPLPAVDGAPDGLLLAVNLSGQSVGDRAFHRWALDLLRDAGAAVCDRLCIEITETVAITNLADAALFIEEVRRLGVRVALDDFGAGASWFTYLKTLPIDFVKIDGQFIRELDRDALDEVAVRSFVDVARVIGIETIAECVESDAVLQKLRAMRLDFAQGFLLHRPQPLAQLWAPADTAG